MISRYWWVGLLTLCPPHHRKDKPACPMEAAPSVYSLEEQEGFFPRQEDSKEEGKREGAAAMFPNKSGETLLSLGWGAGRWRADSCAEGGWLLFL